MSQPVLDSASRMSEQFAEWEAAQDRRRIFLDCYQRMTRNMLAAIDAGRFEDGEWVTRLLHHFAEYYFVALERFDRSDSDVPVVWVHTFVAAGKPTTTVLQNLLMGVNAHINYDLVFALWDVLAPEWNDASDADREMRYRDHCLVNTIIAETIDEVQDEVVERYAPSLDLADKLGGPVDEWVTSWFIGRWREEVWKRAVAMLDCCSDHDRECVKEEVESHAMERARLLALM